MHVPPAPIRSPAPLVQGANDADWEALDTDSAQAENLFQQEQQPPRRVKWPRVLGMLLAIGLLAAVAATPVALRRRPAAAGQRHGRAVSLAPLALWEPKSDHTGCSNWKDLKMKTGVFENAEACGVACSETPGCSAFNFQPEPCDHSLGGTEHKYCFLFSGSCVEMNNSCLDLYVMTATQQPLAWCSAGTRTGCKNWKDSTVGKPTTEDNELACGLRCQDTPGCVTFNFHSRECDARPNDPNGWLRECVLYSSECEKGENECWDLYSMGCTGNSTTPAPGDASAPAPGNAAAQWTGAPGNVTALAPGNGSTPALGNVTALALGNVSALALDNVTYPGFGNDTDIVLANGATIAPGHDTIFDMVGAAIAV